MGRIKLVTLDITGTLLKYVGALGDYYCLSVRKCGFPCPDYGRVSTAFSKAYVDVENQYPNFGGDQLSDKDWWRLIVTQSFENAGYYYDPASREKIFQIVYHLFEQRTPYSLYPEAHPFLNALKRQGLKIGAVSNSDERYSKKILPLFGISHYFDFIHVSKKTGYLKPDLQAFYHAVETAGVDPSETVHVGDHPHKDFRAAREAGLKSVLVTRYSPITGRHGDWEVPSLDKVLSIRDLGLVYEDPSKDATYGQHVENRAWILKPRIPLQYAKLSDRFADHLKHCHYNKKSTSKTGLANSRACKK
eukprot:GFYU01011120.1.p1 GENE.GFYU01011120.1~~GFYU01011120.1.p1  ORF type:complete len:304 (+),score=45.41 GFYU01011120.1:67-978(+)